MKRIAAVATAIASLGVADAATIFTETFEGTQIGRRWNVYDVFGQFVTVDGAGIEIQRSGVVVPAYEGHQYVELDSDFQVNPNPGEGANSAMAALMNLQAGQQYTVTFAYQPRTNRQNDNGIDVSVGTLTDGGQGNRSFDARSLLGTVDGVRSQYGGWQVISMVFTAALGDNALMFAAGGRENELGGFLDDIKVSETPVPAGAVLFGTGLAAFFARRGRKGVA
ncbi:hypothetical protein [Parvularcula lutaonensis]|uniref:DUF642 domain-containing protein n=1 Tax=Parvularcula lutaonensis TaxID=491923 RepID=A0ABV7MFL7_9PROT|nr:hypothetical protein [Parvularcula lutaonensis]GGY53831.1 hypothetical protein GCM10007148_23960 [Parvularcula lutaonensis]